MIAPKIRFKNNDGSEFPEWEEKQLGKIASFRKGKGISKADIDDKGSTYCIRYGELYTDYGESITAVKSRTNIAPENLVMSEINDVIIPASGETQIDIATASCVQIAGVALGGDLNIIKTHENGVFLSYYLNSHKKLDIAKLAQGNSVVHLYPNQLKLLDLKFPSKLEQDKIANFLTVMNKKITKLTQKYQHLLQYKRNVLYKLFDQELRFKDTNKNKYPDYKDFLLREALIKNASKNKNFEFTLVQSVSNKYGFINQDELFEDRVIASKDLSNYYVIKKGAFAYNPSRIDVGSLAYKSDDQVSVVSPLYVSFYTKSDLIFDGYLLSWFESNQFKKQMVSLFEGGVRNTLSYASLSKMIIALPTMEEQEKIANFLTAITEKITSAQSQLDLVKQYKQGLLQQMFV
jgi:type I restriction enzyme S subunit